MIWTYLGYLRWQWKGEIRQCLLNQPALKELHYYAQPYLLRTISPNLLNLPVKNRLKRLNYFSKALD